MNLDTRDSYSSDENSLSLVLLSFRAQFVGMGVTNLDDAGFFPVTASIYDVSSFFVCKTSF